jgi:hypothetical protein
MGGQEVGKGWAFFLLQYIYLKSKFFPIINTVSQEEETSEISWSCYVYKVFANHSKEKTLCTLLLERA